MVCRLDYSVGFKIFLNCRYEFHVRTCDMMGILRIYQNRHPSIQGKACTLFAALALAVTVGACGIFFGASITFRVIFAILHFFFVCLLLTVLVYFNEDLSTPFIVSEHSSAQSFCSRFRPTHTTKMVFVIIGKQYMIFEFAISIEPIIWKMTSQTGTKLIFVPLVP